MYIQQIRNATIKLIYDNVTFLIDPWLQEACSEEEREKILQDKQFIPTPVNPLPLPAEEILKGVDYCLVSHLHEDHFAPDYLPKNMPLVFQNEADAKAASEWGFVNPFYFQEDSVTIKNVTIYKTSGKHGDIDILAEKAGPVCGFVFRKKGEAVVYVAGDTIFCDDVKETIDTYQPDVIVVNACDARDKLGRLIMNKEDVVSTCKYQKGSIVIASHMESVNHAQLTRNELKAYLCNTGYEKQVLIPQDGEKIRL